MAETGEMKKKNTCIRGCCSSTTIPLHLQSYTLLSPIARGSESTVHEAFLPDGRRVAAKKPFLPTSDDLDKFHRELHLLCDLGEHPGLAKLVAAHAWPPGYLLFFELYDSRNLAEKLHVEEWSPSVGEMLLISIRIAEALLYLHNLGILHRDVKPANILLDRYLRPYVSDFGLAMYKKDIKSTFANNWRSFGKPSGGFHKRNMVGTLIYMAPEILSKEIHTEKSDVYSFAVMINEILTGVVPYTDLRTEAQAHTVLEMNYTEQQLTAAVVAEGLRPKLASTESSVPQGLISLIKRCWDPDPVCRPSMADIVEELKSILIVSEEIHKPEIVHRINTFPSNDECGTIDESIDSPGRSPTVQHFQEDLNWSSQGEQISKINDYTTSSGWGIWSKSLGDHRIYQPKLCWGSFATCGRRESMEDAHFLLPEFCKEKDIHVFGIFDGHRGGAAAEFSVRALPGFLQMLRSTTGPAEALTEAFIRTDVAFRKALTSHCNSKRMQKDCHPGCTAVVALVVKDVLFIANAGDCRVVLCRSGQPLPLSRDHVASCPTERARVIKQGTEVKWQVDTWRVGAAALQVTRSIGDDDLKPAVTAEPEIIQTLLSEEDEYLVIASDGLWDVINNEDVISIIRDTVKDPGMCSKRLATEAAQRGSKDNITVIIVFLRPVSTAERIY